jgi:hypothetical protein
MTSLEVAIAEAERFLERAKALQAYRKSVEKETWARDDRTLSAAMKRASLDASKAMAVVRKPLHQQSR